MNLGLCGMGGVLLKIELTHKLKQWWFNVGPLFMALLQHQSNLCIECFCVAEDTATLTRIYLPPGGHAL